MIVSVCPHGYLTNHTIKRRHIFSSYTAVARCSPGGIVIRYVLPVLWMTCVVLVAFYDGVTLLQLPCCNIMYANGNARRVVIAKNSTRLQSFHWSADHAASVLLVPSVQGPMDFLTDKLLLSESSDVCMCGCFSSITGYSS